MRLKYIWILCLTLAACSGPDNSEPKTETSSKTEISTAPLPEPEPLHIAPDLQKMGVYTVDIARDCDGFPRMNLSVPEGLCVGLVAHSETPNKDGKQGLKFPRDILFPIPEHQFSNEFYLTDMGGWGENKGRILSYDNGQLETVIDRLNLSHAIEYGPDGHIYVAEADQLIRFTPPPSKADGFGYDVIITNLPYKPNGQRHLHPLKAFTFSDDNTLWINSGSLSDRCLTSLASGVCNEPADSAAILNFTKTETGWISNPKKNALGLRNSMGLTTHSSGTILQVENGADFKDADRPFEEINRIHADGRQPRFYGWPYCYDRDKQDPDWGPKADFNCSNYNPDYMQPIALLPPHGAPLDLLYAPAGTLNFEEEKLIVPLHGYRETAHRILYFDVDAEGLPVGDANELVFGWNASETGPRGAPVGLTVGPDGAIWGVEDKNKTVFRIAIDQYPSQEWNDQSVETKILVDDIYPVLQVEIFKPNCAACHIEFSGTAQSSFEKINRIGWLNNDKSLYQRLIAKPPKQMPPNKPLSTAEIQSIKAWLDGLD